VVIGPVSGRIPCYQRILRITTAIRLLLTTEISVTNICFDVGYNSLGTFIRRFTELVGRSPCQLRRAAANFMPRARAG